MGTLIIQRASVQETIDINPHYLRAKRVVDLLFTLLILLPLCLVIIIISVAIRLDSAGPVFFRQKRVGFNGNEFTIYKFRSMYANSDNSVHREVIVKYMNGHKLNENSADELSYKQVDDPRVTRVGRLLRKTSIDELPQFFNVLRGEMTLVGPRPPLPYEVEYYRARDWLRLCGKPGLTGTWQVYGRSRVSFQSMVEMDLAYLKQQSLWQDLKLIALTIPVMIKGSGGA